MAEEYSIEDPSQLLQAASDFAFDPGFPSEANVKDFLNRFPLPLIINALQTKADVPGLENALVDCLEKMFKTKYAASLIPHFMPFVVVGLRADSQRVKGLSCKLISCLLENFEETETTGLASRLVVEHDIYPVLLDCLITGDEQVSVAAMDAIKTLASSPGGMEIVFPANIDEATDLRNLAARCSSMGRVRILALIVKLFSISKAVASVIYHSNLLSLLEVEIRNVNDMLITLSVLELLFELAEIEHSAEFLLQTTLLQLLSSTISNSSVDSILRSRAMMISGRLLSKENIFMFVNESSVQTVISAIDGRLGLLESEDADECECALEALGQIGSPTQGAALLLSDSPPAARHIVNSAFDQHGRGKQLAALHSLGNVLGESRSGNNVLINGDAEESLRQLIYQAASKTSKLTPSGHLLSVLRLESDFRIAVFSLSGLMPILSNIIDDVFYFNKGYRVITGLVARPWFLMEICSRQEIINVVTDAYTETTKIGMESRYNCCRAIYKAFTSSAKLMSDPGVAEMLEKLQEAVSKGPYLAKSRREAQPEVATADRF